MNCNTYDYTSDRMAAYDFLFILNVHNSLWTIVTTVLKLGSRKMVQSLHM